MNTKRTPTPSLAGDLRNQGGLLTLAELATLMKRHPETLKTWCREGKIPHKRIVGRTMFDCQTVAAWLDDADGPCDRGR